MKAHINQKSPISLQHRISFPTILCRGARLYALLYVLAASRLFASDVSSSNAPDATPSASNGLTNSSTNLSATTGNESPPGPNGVNDLDEKHQLAIGDQISFRIVEDEEDPKTLTVTDSGELEVPYIGRFHAVGKTCKVLSGQLKAELEKDYYYPASVIIAVNVMAKSRGRVYLVGPVHVPGPQEIPSDETLTLGKAIMRAGGFTDFADRKDVRVRRKSKVPGNKDETIHRQRGQGP